MKKKYLGYLSILVIIITSAVFLRGMPFSISSEKMRIRIGVIPISDSAQVYVAQEFGIFNDEGLEVEIIPMRGGAATLPALSSGAVDVAFTNLVSAVFFEQNVGPLHPVAGGVLMDEKHSESGLLVLKNSEVVNLSNLKGKKIGVNVKHNILALAVQCALSKAGLKPSDYEMIEIPFPHMEAALRSKRVDAIAAPEPFLSTTVSGGGVSNLGDTYILGFGEVVAVGYFTTPAIHLNKKDNLERFNRAMRKATVLANNYDEKTIAAISKHTGVTITVLKKAGRPKFINELPSNSMLQMKNWMQENGFFK